MTLTCINKPHLHQNGCDNGNLLMWR